jgi:hypothetical protein
LDNDGDGLVDMADPACSNPGDDDESDDPVPPQCSDGLDNDGDGLTDMADPGCADVLDDDEFNFVENYPPVADLRMPRTHGAPGMIMDIDGSHSYDPDGDIVSYTWSLSDQAGLIYQESFAGEPEALRVNFAGEGIYQVSLTVVDNDGASDTESETIKISLGYGQCDNGLDDDGDGLIDLADPHCHDENDPYEGEITIPIAPKVFRDMDDLIVTRIDINGHDIESAVVEPGNYLRLSLGLQNNLDYTLEDIKVDVSVQELGIRDSDMLRELDSDDSATVVLNLDIPEGTEPGLYDLRVVVSNDDVRRVKYRVIAVV